MNTFGDRGSLQFPIYDPATVRMERARFRRDALPALAKANSLYIPTGVLPARGWILMARADYKRLSPYSTALQLNVGATQNTNNIGPMNGLAIVQAQCVTRGLSTDPNALYLLEITDGRGVLLNRWFQFPLNAQYNIRAPAYPDTFHPASMNSVVLAASGAPPPPLTTWTWETMLHDMWNKMSPFLGAWPGLPYYPAGTPEGFWFTGVPALSALCGVLDYLGMTLACDLTNDDPYTIVSDGADDPTFDALQAKYVTNLEDDLEWIDVGAGRVPATVVVLFRRCNSVYGTEETVTYRSDGPYQWDMSATYPVTGAAPVFFTGAYGAHYLWSDFTVRYDVDNAPVAADVATAAAIAAERISQYFDRIYSRTSGYMSQTYAGALPFVTGSQVDGVCYSQDYADQSRQGWKTRIVRRDGHPFDGVW